MGLVQWGRDAWQRLRTPAPVASASYSLTDPHLLELFNVGPQSYANVNVSEYTALGQSAFYRAVALITTTIAGLPMPTQREVEGTRTRVSSFLDNPGGPNGPTKFEWTETVLLHLILHGNAYLLHIYNGAGTLAALEPIHPLCVDVEWELDSRRRRTGRKLFNVSLEDGTRPQLTEAQMTHIPAMSLDGLKGVSLIWVARNSLGTAIAGDRAAAKMFGQGALHAGFLSPDEDLEEGDAESVRDDLKVHATGWENASAIAVLSRRFKFTPWTMSHEDAQFLESRQFQVEDVARWTGVPPHLLMQTEKQTSWGTGVSEQNRGLSRYTLSGWTSRIEQRLSRLLPAPRFVEFDFAGLLKPAPEEEIPLLIQQYEAGLITKNEYRRARGMDPVDGGDTFAPLVDSGQQVPEKEAVPV